MHKCLNQPPDYIYSSFLAISTCMGINVAKASRKLHLCTDATDSISQKYIYEL